MPTIKLNPLITDIRNRMGTTVFSKWKDTNYVRGYTPPTDRNTEAQGMVRNAFSRLVEAWKNIGSAARETWNALSAGRNMTGYNAFIQKNFESMKADLALMVSAPLYGEGPADFDAQAGTAAGEITCSFKTPTEKGKAVTLFTQKRANGNGHGQPVMMRYEREDAASPVTLSGLEPGVEYHVYAVLTDGPYDAAKAVSGSVSASAKAGA